MRLRALLDLPDLRLRVLAGEQRLDRTVRWVYTTDLRNPARYLDGGELVLTGMMWRRRATDSDSFVATLAAGRVAALAAGYGDSEPQRVPEDLVAACRRYDVVLFEVPPEVSFATVTERVVRSLAAERDDAPGDSRWRDRLHSLVTTGAGPDAVCALLAAETGVDCWVLSPTGRLVAGRAALSASERTALAHQFLVTERLPRLTRPAGRVFSLLPVSPRQPRVAGWCLALAGDYDAAPAEVRGPVMEVCTLLALDWARQDEAAALTARQGAQLIRSALSDTAAPAEVASRLTVAGFEPGEPIAVVVAASTAPLAPVLQEICTGFTERFLITVLGEETVALLAADIDRFETLVGRLRDGAEAIRPGLRGARISMGVSVASASAAGLRAALEEARHVRRISEHRPGQIQVADSAELTSHGLLLATVPDELRKLFHTRLLGPVLDYDAAHHTTLVDTLEAFLDSDGSWIRCAENLHLHVNTLRYRIRRVEQLTGRNLSSFADRVDLYLALRLR